MRKSKTSKKIGGTIYTSLTLNPPNNKLIEVSNYFKNLDIISKQYPIFRQRYDEVVNLINANILLKLDIYFESTNISIKTINNIKLSHQTAVCITENNDIYESASKNESKKYINDVLSAYKKIDFTKNLETFKSKIYSINMNLQGKNDQAFTIAVGLKYSKDCKDYETIKNEILTYKEKLKNPPLFRNKEKENEYAEIIKLKETHLKELQNCNFNHYSSLIKEKPCNFSWQ